MSDILLEATAEGERLKLAARRRLGGRERPQPGGADRRRDPERRRRQARRYRHGPGRAARYIRRLAAGAADAQLFRARLRHRGDRAQGRLSRADGRGARRQARAGAGAPQRQFARLCDRLGRREHRLGRRFVQSLRQHAGRGGRRAAARRSASAPVPLHLDGAPARQCRLARGADHHADHVSDRLHHRAAGHVPFPQIRRRHLCGGHGRHSGAARNRRADRRHHGGRPLGQRLHRRARRHEDARGDRRAAHHGLRSDRGADPAAHRGADHRRADPHLPRIDGGALWRRAGVLALWRHQSRHFPGAAQGSDFAAAPSRSA